MNNETFLSESGRRHRLRAALLLMFAAGCHTPGTYSRPSESFSHADPVAMSNHPRGDAAENRSPTVMPVSPVVSGSDSPIQLAAAQELTLGDQEPSAGKSERDEDTASQKDASLQSKQDSNAATIKESDNAAQRPADDSKPAEANTSDQNSVEVDLLIQQAIASHPKLQAARSRVAAAQNRIPQARSLPDPMAESMFWPIAKNAQQLASGRMTNQISLSQTVPWPEKLRTQAEIAIQEVGMAQAEVRETEREIVESVRLAYYEVWFSTNASRVIKENRKLMEQVVKIAQNRVRSGGSQQDVLRAELEVEKRDQQILELEQQLSTAQADLATLLQQPLSLAIRPSDKLPLENVAGQLDTLLATAQQCNPTLQNLAWQIQRDLQKQRLATLQKYPDLTYGVQYGMMSTSQAISPVADGIDNISFTVGTNLPIWKTKIRAGICEAAADRASSTQLHQAEWNSIAGRLRRLVQQAHTLDQQRSLYNNKLMPRAQQTLELSQAEYVVGKTTFVQLTENVSDVLSFQIEIARIETALAGVLAQIERTVGCETVTVGR